MLCIRSLVTSIASLTSSAILIPSSSVFVESRSVISEAPLFAPPWLRLLYPQQLLPWYAFFLLLLCFAAISSTTVSIL